MGYSLGVDLGTTFTAAAVSRGERVEIAPLGDRMAAIPSVVLVRADGPVLVGNAADRRAAVEPDRVAREFKRRLGDPTPLFIGGAPHSVPSVLARLLAAVVTTVAEREGGQPDRVVLTHPANWGPYKRELFDAVPRLAEVDRTSLITEPEAAATHYAASERLGAGAVVAVYDFGGGTFDATVLRKERSGFTILGTPEGVEGLGGIDFDEAVFAFVDRTLDNRVTAIDFSDRQAAAALVRLRQECVLAKEALSVDTEAVIPVLLPGLQSEVRLTRAELEEMMRPSIEATVSALRRALRSAAVEPADLTAVLLVGGSSRIPLVSQMVSAAHGRPTAVDAHPKHVTALGAAAMAAVAARGGPRAAPAARGAAGPSGREPEDDVAGSVTSVLSRPDRPDRRAAEPRPTGAGTRASSAAGPRTPPPTRPAPPVPAPPVAAARVPSPVRPLPPATEPKPGPERRAPKRALLVGALVAVVLAVVGGVLLVGRQDPTQPAAPASPAASPGEPTPAAVVASVDEPAVTASIPVGSQPRGIVFSGDGSTAYATESGADSVSVIDTASAGVVARIPIAGSPQYAGLTPDNRRLYVSVKGQNSAGGSVAVVDVAARAVMTTIPVAAQPFIVTVTPDGSRVYLTNYTATNLTVIDTATNAVTATIPSRPTPHAIAFLQDGSRAYVANHQSNLVSILDNASNEVTATVPVGRGPHHLAMSPDQRRVYVANYESDEVSVIDTEANEVVARIPVGKGPQSIAVAPDNGHVYVVNNSDNTVSIINTSTNRVVSTVAVGRSPTSITVRPDGRVAYVTSLEESKLNVLSVGA